MIYSNICFHKRSTWAFPHPLAPAPVQAPRRQGDRLENQIAQAPVKKPWEKPLGYGGKIWEQSDNIWKCMEYIYIYIND